MCFLKSFGKSSRPARVRKLQNDAKKITAPPAMRDGAALNSYGRRRCCAAQILGRAAARPYRNYSFFADLAASSSNAACAAARRATGSRLRQGACCPNCRAGFRACRLRSFPTSRTKADSLTRNPGTGKSPEPADRNVCPTSEAEIDLGNTPSNCAQSRRRSLVPKAEFRSFRQPREHKPSGRIAGRSGSRWYPRM